MKKHALLHSVIVFITFFHTTRCTHEFIKKPLQPMVKASSKLFEIVLSGYTKADTFYDTRQVVSSSEGDAALFPKKKNPDICNRDINSRGQVNMLGFETRLRTDVKGPKVLGAKAIAAIEGDFSGIGMAFSLYDLRHAFVQLKWESYSVVLGQFWHPMFVAECSPDPLPSDGGAPMATVFREPQLRFTYHAKHIDFIAAALTQLNNISPGPDGFKSKYARNSLMPNFHFHAEARLDKHYFGAGIDFKRLVPRLVTNKNIRTIESILSVAGTAYATLNWPKISIKFKINAGQNVANLDMIGGYAVKCVDPVTDSREYANFDTFAFWTEFVYHAKKVEPAIFIGFTKDFGAGEKIVKSITLPDETIESTIYVSGEEIDNVFRISPRLRWLLDPIIFGLEVEYTRAAYGTVTDTGSIKVTDPVANTRFLFSAFYFF